ncbi:MAG: TFIIB-type zinc ribbon-containing protein [Candidatus Micrarchaeota archaeon]
MDVACPQCGNPNLDVDAENSVVYCKKCGFAVRVDPQTGNVTPISQGGASAAPPAQYQQAGGMQESSLFGMDPLTFFMLGTAVLLLAIFIFNLDLMLFGILEVLLFAAYWMKR